MHQVRLHAPQINVSSPWLSRLSAAGSADLVKCSSLFTCWQNTNPTTHPSLSRHSRAVSPTLFAHPLESYVDAIAHLRQGTQYGLEDGQRQSPVDAGPLALHVIHLKTSLLEVSACGCRHPLFQLNLPFSTNLVSWLSFPVRQLPPIRQFNAAVFFPWPSLLIWLVYAFLRKVIESYPLLQ